MTTDNSSAKLFAALAIQELELTLLREKHAYEDWELRDATRELDVMSRIVRKVKWPAEYKALIENFDEAVRRVRETVQNRDTTRIGAAQTKMEQAVFALRDLAYG